MAPTGIISLIAGVLGTNWCGAYENRVTSTLARLQGMAAIVSDGIGGFATQDYNDYVVRQYSGTDAVLTTIAGAGGVSGYVDGLAGAARFSGPSGIATDNAGGYLVADSPNSVLRRLVPTSNGYNVMTVAGRNGTVGFT